MQQSQINLLLKMAEIFLPSEIPQTTGASKVLAAVIALRASALVVETIVTAGRVALAV
jgi:hypothetical protein